MSRVTHYVHMIIRISNSETSCTYKVRDNHFNYVKSRNALLHMLLVCIHSYLKSVLRHNFLKLWIPIIHTPYLREEKCENPWLFFEAKRDPRANKFWATLVYVDECKHNER